MRTVYMILEEMVVYSILVYPSRNVPGYVHVVFWVGKVFSTMQMIHMGMDIVHIYLFI